MEPQGLSISSTYVCISMINHIIPNWDIKDFCGLNYELCTHKDEELVKQYLNSGHSKEKLSMYKYHLPNPMPRCIDEYVIPHFTFLDKVAPAINYFKPGQYLPLHTDLYGKYVEINDVDSKNVVRCMVMLEDSSPGQILQIKDVAHCNWNAGDCFYWDYYDIHAFYNFSMKDRYAIQITGVVK
jgi:hypothetical protein